MEPSTPAYVRPPQRGGRRRQLAPQGQGMLVLERAAARADALSRETTQESGPAQVRFTPADRSRRRPVEGPDGLVRWKRGWSEADLDILRRDFAACASVAELAARLGTTDKALRERAARLGLKRRPEKNP